MEELLSLKWNNHRSTFLHILSVLRDKQLYTDATLACEGRFYSVHRLVLSTCSDYFSAMFDRTICKNPIIVLKDIKCEDLEALLDYMYLGEVNVRQADLASLIKAAECLRVKGLAVPDDEPPRKGRSDSSKIRNDSGHSPPSKRKRRDVIDEVKEDIKPSSAIPKTHIQSRLSPLIRDSMGESGQTSPSHLQNTNKSHTNNISEPINNMEETPFVKVEVEDSGGGEDIGESTYNLSNDSFKEESDADPGADMDKDLPEFLEHASGSSFSHSFGTGPSYQPDLQNWQGDQVLSGNYSGLGYGPSQSQDGSQNTSGASGLSPQAFVVESCFSLANPALNSVDSGSSSGDAAGIQFVTSFERSNCTFKKRASAAPPSSAQNDLTSSRSVCHVCHKAFIGYNCRSNLKRHMTIHAGLKPFRCPFCRKPFNQKSNMEIHQLACRLKAKSAL